MDDDYTPMNRPWKANVLCVDENSVMKISVPFGMTLEEFLKEKNPVCRWCGNKNLKPIYKKDIPFPMS